MPEIAVRDMLHYVLTGMTGEIAAVFGTNLKELPDPQRRAIDKIARRYAGRAVKTVQDHL
jgi:hypothetical protein